MSSRRIRDTAQLIAEMEDEINAWYRTGMDRRGLNSPESVLSLLAAKIAGYRRDFKAGDQEGHKP